MCQDRIKKQLFKYQTEFITIFCWTLANKFFWGFKDFLFNLIISFVNYCALISFILICYFKPKLIKPHPTHLQKNQRKLTNHSWQSDKPSPPFHNLQHSQLINFQFLKCILYAHLFIVLNRAKEEGRERKRK